MGQFSSETYKSLSDSSIISVAVCRPVCTGGGLSPPSTYMLLLPLYLGQTMMIYLLDLQGIFKGTLLFFLQYEYIIFRNLNLFLILFFFILILVSVSLLQLVKFCTQVSVANGPLISHL